MHLVQLLQTNVLPRDIEELTSHGHLEVGAYKSAICQLLSHKAEDSNFIIVLINMIYLMPVGPTINVAPDKSTT